MNKYHDFQKNFLLTKEITAHSQLNVYTNNIYVNLNLSYCSY